MLIIEHFVISPNTATFLICTQVFKKIARNEKAEIEDLFMPFKFKKIIIDSIIAYLLSGIIIAIVFIICFVLWTFVMFGGFEPVGSLVEMFNSFMNS